MNKGRLLLIGAGALIVVALLVLGGSWGILFVAKAQGVATGFEAALARTYQMGRPIPDGQYVIGEYRVEASHQVVGSRQVELKVRVLENRTGLKMVEASSSVAAY
jgi:hypothetical protein